MRFKLTLFLLVLNFVAGYFIYRLEQQSSTAADSVSQDKRVFQDDINAIDRLSITINAERLNETRILQRQKESWQITEPIDWPANQHAIQQILTQLQFLEQEISFSLNDLAKRGQTLADYGLEDPILTLTYSTPTQEPQSLKIGTPTEMGSRVYVLHPNGDEVLVVDKTLLEILSLNLEDLRSQQIFDIPIFEVRAFNVQVGDNRVRIEKEDEQWQLATPIQAPANPNRMEVTLTELANLRALRLLPPSEANSTELGLLTPQMRVTLGGNNRRKTLILGNTVPAKQDAEEPAPLAYYAKLENNPTLFTVPAQPFKPLFSAQDTLRETKFLQWDQQALTGITVAQGNRSITLQKLEATQENEATQQWQTLTRTDSGELVTQPADINVINQLLQNLQELEVLRFVSDAPSPSDLTTFGFDEPNAAVTLQLANQESITLELGQSPPKADNPKQVNTRNIYARLQSEDFVYEVRSRVLALTTTNPLHYRIRSLETLPKAASITQLKVTSLTSDNVLFEHSIDPTQTTWPIALEKLTDKEKGAALNLLDFIKTDFKVAHYINSKFAELPDIPWQYKLEIEINLPGGEQDQKTTREYFFSKRLNGSNQIGGSPQFDVTFVVTQEFLDAFFTLSFKKEPPQAPTTPEEVTSTDPQPKS